MTTWRAVRRAPSEGFGVALQLGSRGDEHAQRERVGTDTDLGKSYTLITDLRCSSTVDNIRRKVRDKVMFGAKAPRLLVLWHRRVQFLVLLHGCIQFQD